MLTSISAGVRPYTLFISWIEKPFNPCKKFSPHIRPISLRRSSLAHSFIGILKMSCCTSTKPTLSNTSLRVEPKIAGRSKLSVATLISWSHVHIGPLGSRVPSSQPKTASISWDSSQPPGSRASKACWAISFSKLHQLPAVSRVCM